jgi:hypothetical protein
MVGGAIDLFASVNQLAEQFKQQQCPGHFGNTYTHNQR